MHVSCYYHYYKLSPVLKDHTDGMAARPLTPGRVSSPVSDRVTVMHSSTRFPSTVMWSMGKPRGEYFLLQRVTTAAILWLGPKRHNLPRPRSPVLPRGFLKPMTRSQGLKPEAILWFGPKRHRLPCLHTSEGSWNPWQEAQGLKRETTLWLGLRRHSLPHPCSQEGSWN